MTALQQTNAKKTRRNIALAALFSVVTFLLVPANAQAGGGSVHIDLPGFSIGFHDDHYKKKRYYRSYRDRRYYRDRRRYEDRRARWRDRERRRYWRERNRYYNDRRYEDRYYYGGRSNRYERNRYRNRSRSVCPLDGYSPYYNDNLNCYGHKDHFHCS